MDETNYFADSEKEYNGLSGNEDVQRLATMAIAQELKNITAELKKLRQTLTAAYSE